MGIYNICQKKSTTEYANQFKNYIAILKWDKKNINNNKTIIFLFRRGFKKNVKNKLICDGVEINNLAILIKKAIAVNDKLYFRAIKKNFKKNI